MVLLELSGENLKHALRLSYRFTNSHEFKVPPDGFGDLWLGNTDRLHQDVETVQRKKREREGK